MLISRKAFEKALEGLNGVQAKWLTKITCAGQPKDKELSNGIKNQGEPIHTDCGREL